MKLLIAIGLLTAVLSLVAGCEDTINQTPREITNKTSPWQAAQDAIERQQNGN